MIVHNNLASIYLIIKTIYLGLSIGFVERIVEVVILNVTQAGCDPGIFGYFVYFISQSSALDHSSTASPSNG